MMTYNFEWKQTDNKQKLKIELKINITKPKQLSRGVVVNDLININFPHENILADG